MADLPKTREASKLEKSHHGRAQNAKKQTWVKCQQDGGCCHWQETFGNKLVREKKLGRFAKSDILIDLGNHLRPMNKTR